MAVRGATLKNRSLLGITIKTISLANYLWYSITRTLNFKKKLNVCKNACSIYGLILNYLFDEIKLHSM